MLSKFCGVPKAAVAICPNLGWGKDFFDAQSMIDPIFNGKNIVPSNNSNYAQLDDPELNAQMDKAEQITRSERSARKAWADIDKKVTGGRVLHPVALGQPGQLRVDERQRRGEQVQLVLGPRVHVAEVAERDRRAPAPRRAGAGARPDPPSEP